MQMAIETSVFSVPKIALMRVLGKTKSVTVVQRGNAVADVPH